jgi:hypothetical protein
LRPEAKTLETGGHILGVCDVIVNEHTTVRQWLAWDARTISDFKLAIAAGTHPSFVSNLTSWALLCPLGFSLVPRNGGGLVQSRPTDHIWVYGRHIIVSESGQRLASADRVA